jgi:hypothetical protein
MRNRELAAAFERHPSRTIAELNSRSTRAFELCAGMVWPAVAVVVALGLFGMISMLAQVLR